MPATLRHGDSAVLRGRSGGRRLAALGVRYEAAAREIAASARVSRHPGQEAWADDETGRRPFRSAGAPRRTTTEPGPPTLIGFIPEERRGGVGMRSAGRRAPTDRTPINRRHPASIVQWNDMAGAGASVSLLMLRHHVTNHQLELSKRPLGVPFPCHSSVPLRPGLWADF